MKIELPLRRAGERQPYQAMTPTESVDRRARRVMKKAAGVSRRPKLRRVNRRATLAVLFPCEGVDDLEVFDVVIQVRRPAFAEATAGSRYISGIPRR
jgi:hypothetical protein